MNGTNTADTLAETQHRLDHYRHFVDAISRALGVPDDSLILPYATNLRRQLEEFEKLKDEAAGLSNVIRAHEGTLVGVRIKVMAMYHEDVLEAVQRAMDGKAQAEREGNDLRRQLEATQAELDQVRQERDRAQRALRVQELEQFGLYDCHGQPLK